MEDEHDMEESDDIADSDWQVEGDNASLLDYKDHRERQVGGGQYFKYWEISRNIGKLFKIEKKWEKENDQKRQVGVCNVSRFMNRILCSKRCKKTISFFWSLLSLLSTPSQRSKDDPQPNTDTVDDGGEIAGDEDDGVDVSGDHLPAWCFAVIIIIIINIIIIVIIVVIIFLPGGLE